jgi:hypothetical protein
MSHKVVTLVYSRKAGSAHRKAVLAYMADRASDDGRGIFASKKTIADEIECGRSTVIKICNEFVEEGILTVTGSRKCANGATVEYAMNLDAVAALERVKPSTSGTSPDRDQNAAYEAAYQETIKFITDLSHEAETAIDAATNMLDDLRNQSSTMLDATPRWQDDQRLFRDKDGDVRDQHGKIIEGLAAEDVVWPEGAPTYEDWHAVEDRITATQTHLEDWQNLRDNQIAPAQDRMTDEDDPPTIEEMEAMRDSLEALAEPLRQVSQAKAEVERGPVIDTIFNPVPRL